MEGCGGTSVKKARPRKPNRRRTNAVLRAAPAPRGISSASWTAIGVAVAVVAAFFGGLQWTEARYGRRVAEEQLRLAQSPNLDVVLHPLDYSQGSGFQARATITNKGTYQIKDARVFAQAGAFPSQEVWQVWQNLAAPKILTVVPNVDHIVTMNAPTLNERGWRALEDGQISVVYAMQVDFHDAAGVAHSIRRCVAQTGPAGGARATYCD